MSVEIKVPEVGESVMEVQVGQWSKQEGDRVERDEVLVEIESEKATVELPAPAGGVLKQILKQHGEMAEVGETIGHIEAVESSGEESPQPAAPEDTEPESASASDAEPEPEAQPTSQASTPGAGAVAAAAASGGQTSGAAPSQDANSSAAETNDAPAHVMPAARRMLAEHNLNADDVRATGPGGRLLKEDVARHVAEHEKTSASTAVTTTRPTKPATAAPAAPAPAMFPVSAPGERNERVVPMSPIRRYIAQRLVEAQQTAALLTTFNELDMSEVIELRKKYRDGFKERHGVKLGFMSFFVKACVDALRTLPQINAQIREQSIVYHDFYDIGIAVGSGKGLVVPIIRNAELLSFGQIEAAIGDFAARAAENRIDMDELRGGTFTISNGGVYGSMLSTPIINPPQSGILGLHAIQDRPVAIDGQVVIRPMMNVALTYDHRIVDGREAVTFLRHIKASIEDPSRMLLEV